MEDKIRVVNLAKTFYLNNTNSGHIKVIRDLSFSLNSKEILSVIGPSGCGKTTLLYIIAGFIKGDSGSVSYDGEEIVSPSAKLPVIFQEYGLFPWMTVQGNIGFGLKAKGIARSQQREIIAKFVELVHLKGFEDKYPHQLSGGMKQRVGIARALALDPQVILMDEPFASLDLLTREVMQEETLQICELTQKTILLITHSIEEAIFLSDRVMIMTVRPGTIKEIVPVDLPRPRSQEVKKQTRFLELKNYISQSLREETLKGIEETGVRLTKFLGEIKLEVNKNRKQRRDS